MSEVVLREIQDDVALLTLNRPDRLNAWTPELQSLYFDLLEECAAREDVRAIVVTGAGRGFCAGADMQHLQAVSTGEIDRAAEAAGAPPTGTRRTCGRSRSHSRSRSR
jgi:enoyl-CoA hydratase/carnithine racemase